MAPSYLKCFKVLLSLKITNILIWFSISFFFSIPNYLSGLIFQDFPYHIFQRQRGHLSCSANALVLIITLASEQAFMEE